MGRVSGVKRKVPCLATVINWPRPVFTLLMQEPLP